EDRIACGNHDGIRQVFTVKNDSAARPSPDQVAFRGVLSHIVEVSKISKRKSRGWPSRETNRHCPGCFEHTFIDPHVHRTGARRKILVNCEAFEEFHERIWSAEHG